MPWIKSHSYDKKLQDRIDTVTDICDDFNIKVKIRIQEGIFKDKITIEISCPGWEEYGIGNKYIPFKSIDEVDFFIHGYDRGYINGKNDAKESE